MDHQRERIQADLRGLLEGDVYCDDFFVQMYGSDASIYQIPPLGVVRPKKAADVAACVDYARQHGLSIQARGAGSGVAGESLGRGLVLDFSAHMKQIVRINPNTVRVQPGLVLAQLNRRLAERGRMFGPDPATRSITTIGSVLALNGSGSHWPRYGSARDRVRSMQVVLASGDTVELGRHSLASDSLGEPHPTLRSIIRRLHALLEERRDAIESYSCKAPTDRCGYRLQDIVADGRIDLARLLVGSEGTLGVITEATIETDPTPSHRGVLLLFFHRIQSAAKAVPDIVKLGADTCDLLDRRLLTVARESDPAFEALLPRDAEAMLLVEHQGEELDAVRDHLRQIEYRLVRRRRLAFAARLTLERDQRDLFWRLARRVVPRLYRLPGATRPLPFVEDIATPPEALPQFIERAQGVLKQFQVTATLFAHAAHGQIHLRPFLDLDDPGDVAKMRDLAAALYEIALEFQGSVSGEHGAGLSRSWFLRRQFGALFEVMREVKHIFDPECVMNPGKVADLAPQPLIKNLRVQHDSEETAASQRPPEAPSLPVVAWVDDDVATMASQCNGCGRCRTQSNDERMCPIFRLSHTEESSPRAKANLMRAVVRGDLGAEALVSESMKGIADLCVHCHQCRVECPASVDVPGMMAEVKAGYVATNGLSGYDQMMLRLGAMANLGAYLPRITNWLLGNPQFRWLLEKFVGIAAGRKLPRIARTPFSRLARRMRLTRSNRNVGRKVAYFVDAYAEQHDVQLPQALVAVMDHNGVEVFVPEAQKPSGMTPLAMGAAEIARRHASANVRILADAVRQGYHVVATEPSALMCLQREYPLLLRDEEAQLVADNSSDACQYLWKMHQAGGLELDFRPLHSTVGYHVPCHARALPGGAAGEELLKLIPGVSVRRLEHGCSGMAGVFGLQKRNYRASLRIGRDLIRAVRDPGVMVGATTCSACRLQMEQGVSKPTIHPIKLLAAAYRRLPDGDALLESRSGELLVS